MAYANAGALSNLPSLRRQHLLCEFAGLKQACPEGVFVTPTPGNPALWSAVLFVRRGPYSSAILRFQISFPDSYPRLPPLVVFSTDMFHPLLTPQTTYMYTTDIQNNGTVSATDEERLPPGGFSLRHGFPRWFARGRRSASGGNKHVSMPTEANNTAGSQHASGAAAGGGSALIYQQTDRQSISMFAVLAYIRSAFDDEAVLDSVPLDAAGNPGAWHAWRTHRRKMGKLGHENPSAADSEPAEAAGGAVTTPIAESTAAARRHGEWNWDGVWEDRVKKAIAASLSDPVLYGNSGSLDEVIRFKAMCDEDLACAKEKLSRTVGNVP